MYSNSHKVYSRRGVAPIIATLLMVAIAVVGGILVLVFAQGFFNTSTIDIPVGDAIQIIAYNATDSDTLTIQLENLGKNTILITDVMIMGINHNITDVSVLSGELKDIEITYDNDLTIKTGRSFKVTVITGNDAEYSIRPTKGVNTI